MRRRENDANVSFLFSPPPLPQELRRPSCAIGSRRHLSRRFIVDKLFFFPSLVRGRRPEKRGEGREGETSNSAKVWSQKIADF
jgi:hypothetical protein